MNENAVQFSKISNFDNTFFFALKNSNRYLTRNIFEYEIRSGHECFVAKKNDEIVFYVWTRKYTCDPTNHKLDKYFIPSKKEIHFFSAVTKEDYRGKNIYPAGIQFLEDFYRKLGYERISCVTLKGKNGKNAAQKALDKIKFEETENCITMTKFLFYKRFRGNFSIKFDNH